MNASFFNKTMKVIFFTAVLTLAACAKKDSSAVRVAGRGTGSGVTPTTNSTANSCSNTQMNWGKIFDSNASTQFEGQVKAFVSATLNPENFGTISGNINDKTGIDFNASFKFDSAGKLDPKTSTLVIKIFDSYVGQIYNGKAVEPYVVEFTQASEGMIDRTTRQIQVKFKDQFGELTFQGQSNGTMVEGTVYFTNYTAVSGYQAASGTLGSFRGYACAMIK